MNPCQRIDKDSGQCVLPREENRARSSGCQVPAALCHVCVCWICRLRCVTSVRRTADSGRAGAAPRLGAGEGREARGGPGDVAGEELARGRNGPPAPALLVHHSPR